MVPDVVYICNIMVTIFQYPGCDVYRIDAESDKCEVYVREQGIIRYEPENGIVQVMYNFEKSCSPVFV